MQRLASIITSDMLHANKPLILGSALWGQPIVHNPSSKYNDDKYNFLSYPPYVSGAGILMNREAMLKIQAQIPTTPIINIDDALIGICAEKAGLTRGKNIRHMAGFQSQRVTLVDLYYDICYVNDVIYLHKYAADDLELK